MSLKNLDLNEIKSSFNFSYSLLLTTGTITFIEAIRTKDPKIRHIMNIETCISLIASYFYSKFLDMVNVPEIDFNKITLVRYSDWACTTPLMLLGLGLVLTYNLNTQFKFKHFIIMIILNYGMLLMGYLGEISKINKQFAITGGFLFFALLFYYIYYHFIKGKKNVQNFVIYMIFVITWSIYGINSMTEPKVKNIIYNILDVIAKAFVGIGLWAYYVKLFK